MPITGVEQPNFISIDEKIRLRKFDGNYDFAFDWYQDEDTVYLVDGVKNPYDRETLTQMYEYLNSHGELYFIEHLEEDKWIPIGDVAFWKDDLPIVIGNKSYRGMGIGKKVIRALIERGRSLGYESLHVNEIYEYNTASRSCFESLGFEVYEQTKKGSRFVLYL